MFEFDTTWLKRHPDFFLDPDLKPYKGKQYPRNSKTMFGAFLDSCPDRWGRLLMRRMEVKIAREEEHRPRYLLESDYLMGVFDESRMGALRFSYEQDGIFQKSQEEMEIPPWTSLRKLEEV